MSSTFKWNGIPVVSGIASMEWIPWLTNDNDGSLLVISNVSKLLSGS